MKPDGYSHATGGVTVAAFYKFVGIDDPEPLRSAIEARCASLEIKGTVLIAREGINATISGATASTSDFIGWLRGIDGLGDLPVKFSQASEHPFRRLKIKVKPEIVSFGAPEAAPALATGKRVEPEAWNELIADPDVILIDTRNDYEVSVGTFENALNPRTRKFSEFPEFVERELKGSRDRRIAMFCTGGIRCEKASAYLLAQGFNDVSQLDGGILRYLASVPREQSRWQGECFVFDERVALEHGNTQGQHALCESCGAPVRAAHEDRPKCIKCSA